MRVEMKRRVNRSHHASAHSSLSFMDCYSDNVTSIASASDEGRCPLCAMDGIYKHSIGYDPLDSDASNVPVMFTALAIRIVKRLSAVASNDARVQSVREHSGRG